MPSHDGSTPEGADPLKSANAVAASEYTSLARDGTPSAASSGARKPGVPDAAPRRVGRRGHAEVHELHAPTLGQDQVRRLDVAVDDRRVLGVQVGERLRRLGEVGEHARRRQTRPAPIAQQRGEVGAVHPVHGHDVPVAVEEVLSHQRKRRMRRNRKQDACLVEELVAQPLVAHLADLQRDESVVLAVQGLDDVSLAARAERPQHLVAVLDEPLASMSRRFPPAGPWRHHPSWRRFTQRPCGGCRLGCRQARPYLAERSVAHRQGSPSLPSVPWPLITHSARAHPSGCFGCQRSTGGSGMWSSLKSEAGNLDHGHARYRARRLRRRRQDVRQGGRHHRQARSHSRRRAILAGPWRGARVPARWARDEGVEPEGVASAPTRTCPPPARLGIRLSHLPTAPRERRRRRDEPPAVHQCGGCEARGGTAATRSRSRLPGWTVKRFDVTGVPGAFGSTARNGSHRVGNVTWVEGRCVMTLGNEAESSSVAALRAGVKAVHRRVAGRCP